MISKFKFVCAQLEDGFIHLCGGDYHDSASSFNQVNAPVVGPLLRPSATMLLIDCSLAGIFGVVHDKPFVCPVLGFFGVFSTSVVALSKHIILHRD